MVRRMVWLPVLLLLSALAAPAQAGEPVEIALLRDVAYGPARLQTMDVYLPPDPQAAPVILMVHGGAWAFGDKGNAQVLMSKVARWASRGFILVSVNYPMIPDNDPIEQADHVARALAAAQAAAPGWGGDPERFILMGHSAGAHLVSLLNADPQRATTLGARPWLGAISLDGGALDVPAIMEHKHPKLYDRAFGDDPVFWEAASPAHRLTAGAKPWLGVCSTRHAASCGHNKAFAAKAQALGARAETLGQKLSHGNIARQLGLPGAYTDAVEEFMASLDPAVAALLAP